MAYNVKDYGAKGNGENDDTAAFQKALDEAGNAGGGIVSVPRGTYLIATHLDIPDHVTLEGVWRVPTAWSQYKGTTLLAVEGAGDPDSTPFITLHTNSTIKGITIFYPEQTETNPPIAYPWCIASGGADNCSIVDCLLVNPYQAVDFGSRVAGRHYIKNLYAQPLYRGLFIDQCYDVGRVEDVHFWPFWKYGEGNPVTEFMLENAEAFIIGRTDWEYMFNCFCISYNVGFHFVKVNSGPGNVLLNTCGSDVGPVAVMVDDTQYHSGVSFSNSQMYGDIIVKPTNFGPVKFTGCGFFGSTDGKRGVAQAHISGAGQVSFSNCHFRTIDPKNEADKMIVADGGGLTIVGCDFMDANKEHIVLERGLHSAIILGNRFRGTAEIVNNSTANVQIGFNVDDKETEKPRDRGIIIDNADEDAFVTEGEWHDAAIIGDYEGTTVWAFAGKGECKATWTPDLPHKGPYDVYIWFGPDPIDDHATNMPVTVNHLDGSDVLKINLKENHSQWNLLGRFKFADGRSGSVTVTNEANGNVLADAVKFVPVKRSIFKRLIPF